jgi:hypothetical protein
MTSAPAVPTVGPGPIARTIASESRRVRGDPLPWAFLPVIPVLLVSLLASLPSDLRIAPTSVIVALAAELSASVFSLLLLVVAVLGALGVTLADKAGVLAREELFGTAAGVFGARASSSVLTSLLFGAVGIVALETAFAVAYGHVLLPTATAMRTLAAMAAAGLWGHLVGVLIRSPILVLFVVPATLMPAALLADVAPALADVLPMQTFLSSAGLAPEGLGGAASAVTASAWLLVLGAAALLALRRRDRL